MGSVDQAIVGKASAAIFSDHMSRCAWPIVDLQKVKVALSVVLHVEHGEGQHEDLCASGCDLPSAADAVSVVRSCDPWITERSCLTGQIATTRLLPILTEVSSEFGGTVAAETSSSVDARPSILTRAAATLVDIRVTVATSVARVAGAHVGRTRHRTCAVLTRVACTGT